MEQSGRFGTIGGIPAIRQWSLSEGFSLINKTHSGSGGVVDRAAGIYDWSGSISGFGVTTTLLPGSSPSLQLYKGPDSAGSLTTGELFTGSVYIDQLTINWNFESNEPINWSANFGGNGALVLSAANRPTDAVEDSSTPCAGKIVLVTDDGVTETVIPWLKSATLAFTRPALQTVNSGAINGAGKCVTKRRVGAPLDWTLALVSDDGNEAPNLSSGTISRIRCYVDATRFYDLRWGIFGQRTNISVNPETGAFTGQTYNVSAKAIKAGVTGAVLNLSGATMVVA